MTNDNPTTGSGDGGTLGTPSTDNTEDVPSNTSESSVVSGGGVADTSQADRDASARPGLRAGSEPGGRTSRTPTVVVGLVVLAVLLLLLYLLA